MYSVLVYHANDSVNTMLIGAIRRITISILVSLSYAMRAVLRS